MTVRTSGPSTILCIDDDPLQQLLLERLVGAFEHSRYAFKGVLGYDEGLAELASGRHAVCLLDYQLGQGNGLDLLRDARRTSADTPVIVITVADAQEVDIAAAEAGAVDFLPKTELTPRVLERAVRYAVRLGTTLQRLRALALRDELTGLLNRREMRTLLQDEWLRSARFSRPFSFAIADIDYFKRVNDQHGHPAGDEVIRHVAQIFETTLRRMDRVARVGGEEFAVLMPETGRRQAVTAMDRIRAALVRSPCVLPAKDGAVPVTISAGIGVSLEDAGDPDALIAVADKRLYAAKRSGRDRVCADDGQTAP